MSCKPQVYDIDTKLNFGQYNGYSILDWLYFNESYRDGECHLPSGYDFLWIIYTDHPLFIPSPELISALDKIGLLDDLHRLMVPEPKRIKEVSSNDPVELKRFCISRLYKKFDEYTNDPSAYENRIEIQNRIESELDFLEEQIRLDEVERRNAMGEIASIRVDEPFEIGSSSDPNENPWLGILPDDEAETAYWNTD